MEQQRRIWDRCTAAQRGLGLLALVCGVMAAGCREKQRAESESSAKTSTESAPVEVRLGYFANVTHAQAVLGVASGEFEKAIAPSKLTTRVFNAGPSLIEALFAGEIDMGYVGPGPALSAFEKSHGETIRVLAGAAANGVVIVARVDSGIKSMADLAGKRVATPQAGNTQDISARHYMIGQLKQPNADNVIAVANAEQSAMMSRGQIDAAWVPEPWGARLIVEAGGVLVAEEKDLWPNKEFVLTVVVVNPVFAAKHPDVVEKMLRVHAAWTARLQTQLTSCTLQLDSAMQALTSKKIERAVLEQAISRVNFTDEPFAETFQTYAQWSFDLGFFRSKPDVSKLIDTTILGRVRANPQAVGGQAGTTR